MPSLSPDAPIPRLADLEHFGIPNTTLAGDLQLASSAVGVDQADGGSGAEDLLLENASSDVGGASSPPPGAGAAPIETLPPPTNPTGQPDPTAPPTGAALPSNPGGPAGLFAPPPATPQQLPAPPTEESRSDNDEQSLLDNSDDDLLSPSGDSPFPLPPGPSSPNGSQPAATGSAAGNDPPKSDKPEGAGQEQSKKEGSGTDNKDPHADLYARNLYPSAQECRVCHEQIYDEWAMSSHAYAAVSPMFHKFEQTITDLSKGTVGYFCMRCHSPVGTSISHPRHESIWHAIPAAREGVTCIVCHRVRFNYTKSDGERRIEPGTIYDPVYGAGYGQELANVLQKKDHYKVKTSAEEKGPGQPIHTGIIHFEQIKLSHACASCHQVAVEPGIKLEVVWEQYRASPACKLGIQCQDCHMGKEPGVPIGYDIGPVAIVNEKKIDPQRKHSNHTFYGPGYSILHPGLFPLNPKSEDWKPEEWMQFDYRAGWGTEKFEQLVKDQQLKMAFPKVWENADERMDAREIVDANLKKLVKKAKMRRRLMENTSRVEGPIFECAPVAGQDLNFQYVVRNLNNGHNMPSGSLGAQPQIWLNVVLTGPHGNRVWESGYVDRNGDIADLHSLEVAAKRIAPDQQLFNLQSKFLITHAKGPDREMYLPINTDFDQLPFLRPSPFPVKVLNHPPFIRMEAHSLTPNGIRAADYVVPGTVMVERGMYRLTVRMRFRPEPIYFMRFCRSTAEMERTMNEWMLDFNESSMEFLVR